MLRLLILLIITISITSCTTSSPEDVMPPIVYTDKINFHSSQVAHLSWQVGRMQAESNPTYISPEAGLVAALITASIDSAQRNRNPGQYNYSFGKAHQAVFMTSLRDALDSQHVFKDTRLDMQTQQVNKDDIYIIVNFKSTRAHAASGGYGVILDVVLTVKRSGKADFERTYFVESDPDNSKDKSFRGQQIDASEKLITHLIKGIITASK